MGLGVRNFNPPAMAQLRARAGLGMKELADCLGQLPPNVVAWEKGRVAPTPRHLVHIAAVLEVEPWRLTTATPETAELADLRAWAGLTTAEAAASAGVSRRTWSNVERGLWPLGPERARDFAEVLGVSSEAVQAAYQRVAGRHLEAAGRPGRSARRRRP
ncbi:MAG: helix-turn-helix domain-containing protein [Actinobacteria bacterium]|nr:helix-turn-helix domain-containing protein [Actinomycetota bacterium]